MRVGVKSYSHINSFINFIYKEKQNMSNENTDDLNFDLYGEFISSQEYCIFSSARKILSMKY